MKKVFMTMISFIIVVIVCFATGCTKDPATPSNGGHNGEGVDTTNVIKPTVKTSNASDVTVNSAKCGGEVIDEGNAEVTRRGVCYKTSPNPTISDNVVEGGDGIGSFECNLTGLSDNTTYFVKAFATNSGGTSYGEQINFKTINGGLSLPTVTTVYDNNLLDVGVDYCYCGGNVTSDGGLAVTNRGICYGITPNPTISNDYVTCGTGTGSFRQKLTGLNENTTYYVRAFAINDMGVAYGTQKSFKTKRSVNIYMGTGDLSITDDVICNFYDNGGPNDNYYSNCDDILTIKAPNNRRIKITFDYIDTANNHVIELQHVEGVGVGSGGVIQLSGSLNGSQYDLTYFSYDQMIIKFQCGYNNSHRGWVATIRTCY